MTDNLFDRLGGAPAVFEMVNSMYTRVQEDPELSPFFKDVQWERLKKMQFEFISAALGGPVQYAGAEIQAVHAGRDITPTHFSKFVGHLASVMEERGVHSKDVDDVLGRLAMYRDRIVGGSNVDG